MFGLFNKKKKFSASCDLSGSPLDRDSSYLLTTAQIISSRKFWDNIMTEPDTLSYTEAHFKKGDETAKNIRNMIFKKYAKDKLWVISDSQIHLFDVDESAARELAQKWWDSEGNEFPSDSERSLEQMNESDFTNIRDYAIQEAGRRMVRV